MIAALLTAIATSQWARVALRCATGVSDPPVVTVCPTMVEYSREFQLRAAAELDALPKWSAIIKMLSDYAVMRDQARSCEQGG